MDRKKKTAWTPYFLFKSDSMAILCTKFKAHSLEVAVERDGMVSECDPMHCELNVTWKLFVENNNDE